jgi:hypothetical protein
MRVYLLVLCVLLFDCGEYQPGGISTDFFPMDSLLTSQSSILIEQEARLIQVAHIDEEAESKEFLPDSMGWANAFRMFRDFDLNRPENIGAYILESNGNTIKYLPKPDENVKVRELRIELDDLGQPEIITGALVEEKGIYTSERNVKIIFSEGVISSFLIEGYQRMILQDTSRFKVQGKISIN